MIHFWAFDQFFSLLVWWSLDSRRYGNKNNSNSSELNTCTFPAGHLTASWIPSVSLSAKHSRSSYVFVTVMAQDFWKYLPIQFPSISFHLRRTLNSWFLKRLKSKEKQHDSLSGFQQLSWILAHSILIPGLFCFFHVLVSRNKQQERWISLNLSM